ncbi:transmembrane protein 216, partial [Austrofundulus limnaeus]|uniref:Transmembrane protein 216 n=1 Tax=Austrofundulus limnaeus TaxID=52670 RepID=A0A2I4ALM9_AUSLI
AAVITACLSSLLVLVPAGWKGNLCERSLSSCTSLLTLLPCAALAVYYLLLQTFVLRLEFLLGCVLLCFYGLELLLGVTSVLAFSRSRVY